MYATHELLITMDTVKPPVYAPQRAENWEVDILDKSLPGELHMYACLEWCSFCLTFVVG
jgi:hypothetical protein